MAAPSVLLVDDGELDSVQALLQRLRVDWVRSVAPASGSALERPRDLLITSGPRAMEPLHLAGDAAPLWVCIYGPEFLPLREQLRDAGVHYLVSGDLAPRILELFLRQLLHEGWERRQVRRIPLQCEADLEVGFERRKATLYELSREGCVLATDTPIPAGRRLILHLPPELTSDDHLDLKASVLRSSAAHADADTGGVITALRFDSLEAEDMARIHDILSGHATVTPVTPLSAEPPPAAASSRDADALLGRLDEEADISEGWRPDTGERRGAPRHEYSRPVDALCWPGESEPRQALGCDLSASGLRITSAELPARGSRLSLALYGGAREEPLLVAAEVVRVADSEVGLAFRDLDGAARRRLERLMAAAPVVEALEPGAGPVYVAELLEV